LEINAVSEWDGEERRVKAHLGQFTELLNNHIADEMERYDDIIDKQDQLENKLVHIENRMEAQYQEMSARFANMSTSINAFIEGNGDFIRAMKRAFPRDDTGEPDYDGHRTAHLSWIQDSKDGKELKAYIQKVVLAAGAIAVVSWLWAVVWPAFLHGPR